MNAVHRGGRPGGRHSWRTTVILAASVLLATAPVQSQSLVADCNPSLIKLASANDLSVWSAFAPDTLSVRFLPAREGSRWVAIADTLARFFLPPPPVGASAIPPASDVGLSSADRLLLRRHFAEFRAELAEAEAHPERRVQGVAWQDRFRVRIEDDSRPARVVLFRAQADSLVLTESMPTETRRAVCWLAHAAMVVTSSLVDTAFVQLAQILRGRADRWDNFMDRGYSMLPQELFINDWLRKLLQRGESFVEPPRLQLIAGHPTAATSVVGRSFTKLNELQRSELLALEPLGLLFYGPGHRWYAGGSLLWAFPDNDGAAVGVMAHLGRLGRLGYAHRGRKGDRPPAQFIVLSLDLYGRLTGAAELWKKAKSTSLAECRRDPEACRASVRN